MKKALLLILLIIASACSKTIDESWRKCKSKCTTLEGRFISMNEEGVKGVKVKFEHITSHGMYGRTTTREIVKVISNENGNFHKNFYIRDNELGENPKAEFLLTIDDTELDVSRYILVDNLEGSSTSYRSSYRIPEIHTRDTVIKKTFYIPKKARIIVNLKNFEPFQQGDFFEVQTYFPFGPNIGYNEFLDSEYDTGKSGWNAFMANGINTTLHPYVAENEKNIIRIVRKKDGVITREDHPVFVPSNNTIEMTFDY